MSEARSDEKYSIGWVRVKIAKLDEKVVRLAPISKRKIWVLETVKLAQGGGSPPTPCAHL